MPEQYTPTAEHLARLGYAPADLDRLPPRAWPVQPGTSSYYRHAPWPGHPYYALLLVHVLPTGGLFLDVHAKEYSCSWPGHPVPTPLFLEQLLQAVGWPVSPPLPIRPAASAELMLLRWIAQNPAEAYRLRYRLDEYSCLPGLLADELVHVTPPAAPPLGARLPSYHSRPGLIELTDAGINYLHLRRHYSETPENFPTSAITETTKGSPQ